MACFILCVLSVVFRIPVVNQTQHERRDDETGVGVGHIDVKCAALATNELGANVMSAISLNNGMGPILDDK